MLFHRILLGIAGLCFASSTWGQQTQEVCVRNSAAFGTDPCARGLMRHAYVINERSEETICTMTYDDNNCKIAPREFDHVKTPGGQVVCTVNYHNPPISAQCATNPDQYSWVTAAYQPNP